MKKILFSAVVLASLNMSAQYKNVMYYGDWSVWGGQGNFMPKNLPAELYTHLNFAFLDFDAQGNLELTDPGAAFGNPVGESFLSWDEPSSGIVPAFVALKAKNPNLKIGVSLGGWSKSRDFTPVAADPAARAKFIANVMHFIQKADMDFVDVDWEYPTSVRTADLTDNKNDEGTPLSTPADRDNILILMTEFRAALDKLGTTTGKTYTLSLATHGTGAGIAKHMDIKKISNVVDFINLMTYDLSGAFDEKSGHQTPLYTNPNAYRKYSIDEVVKYCLAQGVPSNQLVIGAAFYTRGWDSVDVGPNPATPGLFQVAVATGQDADNAPSRGAKNDIPLTNGDQGRLMGLWAYRNLDKLKASIPDLTEYWDDVSKASYFYSASTKDFYTYDSPRAITEKTNYVKSNSLGGVITWMASQDKPTTGDKRDVLTKVIKEGLFGTAPLAATGKVANMKIDNIKLNTKIGTADSGKPCFEFEIQNNEVLGTYTGANDALKGVDNFYASAKRPRFIITMMDGSTLAKGDWKAGTVTISDTGDSNIGVDPREASTNAMTAGVTTVDISSQYDGKYILPGATYTFKMTRTDGAAPDWNQVKQVDMEQYYDNAGAVKLANQTIYINSVLSTNEVKAEGLNIYPTVVSNTASVFVTKAANIEIVSMAGNTVAKYTNVENFPAPSTVGVYLVKISTKNDTLVKKLIVK